MLNLEIKVQIPITYLLKIKLIAIPANLASLLLSITIAI